MNEDTKRFIAGTAPRIIDDVREEAARCCEETARWERGERDKPRNPMDDGLRAEFSDAAFGVAGEVANLVCDALLAAGMRGRFSAHQAWDFAATLLRAGWKRGDFIQPVITGKAQA